MADQKLNIIFTGDVSQLDKAINEALQDVTSFENKIKGLASLDLGKLSSEIDSIRSKFSTLDIKIDSQKALSELNKISGQLSGVKDVLIDVDVNDAEVKSQIDSIVQRIKAIDLGTLSFPDIQGETSEINQILADLSKLKDTDVLLKVDNAPALAAINQVEANLKDVRSNIVVQVDSTKVNQDIQDIKAKFAAFGEIDIKADPSGALAAIDKILIDINSVKSQEVILQADNSEALASINEVQSRLQAVKSNILVSVDIGQSVEEIKAKFLALGEIDIKADPSQALDAVDVVLADIAKLKSSEVFLKADNSQLLAAINQVENRAKDIKARITVDTSAALSEVNSLLTKINGLKGKDISINLNGTQVIRTVDQIEKELLQLAAALKKATDPRDVAKLTQQLSLLSRSINGINVNQFSNIARGSQSATFALTNLGRVAQDSSFGFIGIANNLNPLLESFQRLRAEAGSNAKALKLLASSLMGAGGVGLGLSIVTAALQFSQLGFSAWTRGMNGAKDKAEETGEALFDLSSTLEQVAGDLSKNASKVTGLFAAINSGKLNFEERKAALKELGEINREFFGSLKEEEGLIKGLQTAYDGYLLRLKEIGRSKAIEIQLTKLFNKKLELELAIDPKFVDAVDPVLQKQIGALREQLKSLGGAVDFSKEKFDISQIVPEFKVDTATKKVIDLSNAMNTIPEWGKEVDKNAKGLDKVNGNLAARISLMQRISQLERTGFSAITGEALSGASKELNDINLQIEALSALLQKTGQFEIKTPDPKKLKDATDDIIARAKLFVKEFGDSFVVPDLEITFFKDKNAVLKDAKQLLGDIAKGNLKIKLPVQTEFEFLPVTEGVPQSVIDNFFKGISLEKGIPLDVKIDPSLSVDSRKLADEKVKLFGEFSKLGKLGTDEFFKIDFSNINKGIQEGTRLLQGMVDIASTLNQSIGQGLTNAFNAAFDAALEGKNVFKALGEALKQLIIGTIKAIAQMLILKAITSLIFPGLNTPLPLSIPGISRGRVGSAAPSFGGGIGGGRMAPSFIELRARGADLVGIVQLGSNQIGRVG